MPDRLKDRQWSAVCINCNLLHSFATFKLVLQIFFLETIISNSHAQQVFPNSNAFSRLQRTWRPEEIFPSNYNNQQIPIANLSSSLDVEVSLHISSIKLSDNQNTLLLDVFFLQAWIDDRLVSPPALPPTAEVTLDYRWKQAFWTPQLQITSARIVQIGQLVEPLLFLSVSRRNRVQLHVKMTIEIVCSGHGTFSADSTQNSLGTSIGNGRRDTSGTYPFDRRECILEFVSLSSPVEMVALRWRTFDLPMQKVHGFTVSSSRTEHCISRLNDAAYSCLRARFRLQRNSRDALLNHFLPSLSSVLLAYLSFWIPLHSLYVHPRITTLVAALALLCLQLNALTSLNVPLARPAQGSALRNWLLMCFSFTILALVEFTLAIYHQSLKHVLVRQLVDQQQRKQAAAERASLNRNATIALRTRQPVELLQHQMQQPHHLTPDASRPTELTNGRSNLSHTHLPSNNGQMHHSFNQQPQQQISHGIVSSTPNYVAEETNNTNNSAENLPHLEASNLGTRFFSKILLLNQDSTDEKRAFEPVWIDQLFKILYPVAFVVCSIIYALMHV